MEKKYNSAIIMHVKKYKKKDPLYAYPDSAKLESWEIYGEPSNVSTMILLQSVK